jgi:hypothetical protein
MPPPAIQALVLVAGLGWACFRIFGPQADRAPPSDRLLRKRERIFLAVGLFLFCGGIPAGIYLSDLLQRLGLDFWLRFGLEMIPSLCGGGLIMWALALNLREYKPV